MPLTKPAILFYLKPVWCFLFVFCRCVVSVLAFRTCKGYKLPHLPSPLFYDLGAHPGTYGLAAFPDGKAEFFSRAMGETSSMLMVTLSPGITISTPFGKFGDTGYVGGSDIELGTIAGEERVCRPPSSLVKI